MVKRSALIEALEEDFKERLPGYHKSRREGLTTLAGVMLEALFVVRTFGTGRVLI